MIRTITRHNKYRAVAALLEQDRGTLLDIGARDRVLSTYLSGDAIDYRSADVDAGLDYQVNLEANLPFGDAAFDIVVALDVLEHVDRMHHAFAELGRIARRRLIVGLPNLASFPRRWSFLLRADLGTRKYDLMPDAVADRHRWLTMYSQMNEFVAVNARRHGLALIQRIEEIEGGPLFSRLGVWAAKAAMVPDGFLVQRCIYILERPAGGTA